MANPAAQFPHENTIHPFGPVSLGVHSALDLPSLPWRNTASLAHASVDTSRGIPLSRDTTLYPRPAFLLIIFSFLIHMMPIRRLEFLVKSRAASDHVKLFEGLIRCSCHEASVLTLRATEIT